NHFNDFGECTYLINILPSWIINIWVDLSENSNQFISFLGFFHQTYEELLSHRNWDEHNWEKERVSHRKNRNLFFKNYVSLCIILFVGNQLDQISLTGKLTDH